MKLIMTKGETISFEALPSKSIALDGYVQGPQIDAEGERYSFDHHAGCIRFATRSTVEQVQHAVKLGLDPRDFTVYANDVDLDSAASIFLLRHPELVDHPLVQQLVWTAGIMDSFVGAYPMEGSHDYLDWIVEPVMAAREAGFYHRMGEKEYETMVEIVESRILQWIQGRAPAKLVKEAYARLHGTPRSHYKSDHGWEMFESSHLYDTGMLLSRGHLRVVRYHESEKRYHYTVARRSDFVAGFPLPEILAALNAAESQKEGEWGGGSTVGGSPRPGGSLLPPEEVSRIVDRICARRSSQ